MEKTTNKLQRSGILTGQLECFCLACDVKLYYDTAEAHCSLVEHEANFQKTTLVENYASDGIRKVSHGYFCEICNLFMRIHENVKTHVTSPQHAASKNASKEDCCPKIEFKVTPEGAIAFGCLKIRTNAWNGVVENNCIVCGVNVDDIAAHIENSTHVANLIQARVVRKNLCLYRKIESSVQCLTCNKLIPEKELMSHIESSQHETVFNVACDGRIKKKSVESYDVNNKVKIKHFISKIDKNEAGGLCLLCDWSLSDSEFNSHPNHYHHQTLLRLHNKWIADKKNEFIVLPNDNESTADGDKSKGVGPKNDSINNEELDLKIEENGYKESVVGKNIQGNTTEHNATHDVNKCNVNTKTENVDRKHEKVTTQSIAGSSKDAIEEIKELANDFALKYKSKDNIECTLCKEAIKGTINDIKAHISSAKHRKNFFKKTNLNSTNYETKRMSEVVKLSSIFSNVVTCEMIINSEFCIKLMSYHVFVHEGDKGVKCHLCNKFVDPKEHSLNEMHKRLWGNSLMVTSFEKEFVREVKKGVYHCGFCNIIFTSWDPLLTHLMSLSHRRSKMAAEKALVMHLKDLMHNMARLL